jgi:Zn-dependent oligopeptidase
MNKDVNAVLRYTPPAARRFLPVLSLSNGLKKMTEKPRKNRPSSMSHIFISSYAVGFYGIL